MSNYIIGVDPGVKQHALATMLGVKLAFVDFLNTDKLDVQHVLPEGRTDIVIELPQVYTASKQKGDPNDLIRLAYHAGRLGMLFDAFARCEVETIYPREWKGTIKKEIMTNRILSKLEPSEIAVFNYACKKYKVPASKQHNLIDAIGIALWKAGRL